MLEKTSRKIIIANSGGDGLIDSTKWKKIKEHLHNLTQYKIKQIANEIASKGHIGTGKVVNIVESLDLALPDHITLEGPLIPEEPRFKFESKEVQHRKLHPNTLRDTLLKISGMIIAQQVGSSSEGHGDFLQIALPITTIVTSYKENGIQGVLDFGKKFGENSLITNSTKQLTADQWIGKRPIGGGNTAPGFPSGHTGAATIAADYISNNLNSGLEALTQFLAGYTGGSRVAGQ